ncbi:uncharacterized protein FIBRA_04121 [Fibroporia radiculosa]|uniref:Uncharacterized protein n=1 Tax=Fibroporia radiculosa TaxID=599839 RepID=J4GNX7_9APHY|nr:uncharacterized protein FIBRA_04121 [Fibroporia radiculosa]CCM02045.1 predicted protein [Fibroporia radiculosa]
MDVWEKNELAALAHCLWGQHAIQKILDFSSRWGPSPRCLVRAYKDPYAVQQASASIQHAARAFVEDFKRASSSLLARSSSMPSAYSPVLWIRPKPEADLPRGEYKSFVPAAAEDSAEMCKAVLAKTATEQVTLFQQFSRHATSCDGGTPFAWYTAPTVSPGNLTPIPPDLIITTAGRLQFTRAPFYYLPSIADYPGIDAALCTNDGVYAIQSTLSSEHSSAEKGLVKLEGELSAEHRCGKKAWFLIIAHENAEGGYAAAEDHRKKLSASWKIIMIGYFVPASLRGLSVASFPK